MIPLQKPLNASDILTEAHKSTIFDWMRNNYDSSDLKLSLKNHELVLSQPSKPGSCEISVESVQISIVQRYINRHNLDPLFRKIGAFIETVDVYKSTLNTFPSTINGWSVTYPDTSNPDTFTEQITFSKFGETVYTHSTPDGFQPYAKSDSASIQTPLLKETTYESPQKSLYMLLQYVRLRDPATHKIHMGAVKGLKEETKRIQRVGDVRSERLSIKYGFRYTSIKEMYGQNLYISGIGELELKMKEAFGNESVLRPYTRKQKKQLVQKYDQYQIFVNDI